MRRIYRGQGRERSLTVEDDTEEYGVRDRSFVGPGRERPEVSEVGAQRRPRASVEVRPE